MIRIGLNDDEKRSLVERYASEHRIRKVVFFSPTRFRPTFRIDTPHEHVEWSEIIKYVFYYRLLQEVDGATLLVVNECLRSQDRHDLTYNCLRNYLNQTPHQIVFQYLPIIDTVDNLSILVDLDTRSRWRRDRLLPAMLADLDIHVASVDFTLSASPVQTDTKMRSDYARTKRAIINGIGGKDPHTIPRQLHLLAGRAKLSHVSADGCYVGRNNRFGLANLSPYRDIDSSGDRTVFEFCHNAIDFADFLAVSRQSKIAALVSDLRVDTWYFERYRAWLGRVHEAYAILRG